MKMDEDNLLITLVYVDDLIFGNNNDELSQKFAQDMSKEFQMSMIGELSYFLELQVTQTNTGMFISQAKYLGICLSSLG